MEIRVVHLPTYITYALKSELLKIRLVCVKPELAKELNNSKNIECLVVNGNGNGKSLN